MNTPESVHVNQTVNESLKSKTERYLLKAGTVGALSLLALTGCSNTAESAPEDTNTTVIDAGKSDQEKTPEKTEDPYITAERIKQEELYAMPKPDRWDELDAMTLEEFEAEDVVTRLTWALYLNRDAEILAQRFYDITQNEEDLIPINVEMNPNNTAAEITADVRSLQRGASMGHFWHIEDAAEYTTLQRQKMAAAVYEDPSSAPAVNWKKSMLNTEVTGLSPSAFALEGVMLADETYSEVQTYTHIDEMGVERPGASYLMHDTDGKSYTGAMMLVDTIYGSHWVSHR